MNTFKSNKLMTIQDKTKFDLDMKKIHSDRPNTVFPKQLRPLTGFTNVFDANTSKISKQNLNVRPYSTNSLFNQTFNKSNNFNIKERENVEIEDRDKIDRILIIKLSIKG